MKPKQYLVLPAELLAKWMKEVNQDYPYYVVLESGKRKAILCSYELFEKIDKKLCKMRQGKK
ncbi:hypothetical protein M0R04_12150 [Candidatus Dojkabacteria bacterium]|jgi:hypothetical protein|nr:hypothetical protein [Candidatus Dojkabacteria bacterium]